MSHERLASGDREDYLQERWNSLDATVKARFEIIKRYLEDDDVLKVTVNTLSERIEIVREEEPYTQYWQKDRPARITTEELDADEAEELVQSLISEDRQ